MKPHDVPSLQILPLQNQRFGNNIRGDCNYLRVQIAIFINK